MAWMSKRCLGVDAGPQDERTTDPTQDGMAGTKDAGVQKVAKGNNKVRCSSERVTGVKSGLVQLLHVRTPYLGTGLTVVDQTASMGAESGGACVKSGVWCVWAQLDLGEHGLERGRSVP